MKNASDGPTAAYCMRALLNHMEINLRNRVEAKTNRHAHNRFENSNYDGGAGHRGVYPNKVAAPRARRYLNDAKCDIGYVPSPLLKDQLRPIFQHYASVGTKDNYTYLSRTQFLRFARDCGLVVDGDDRVAVDLVFDHVVKTAAIGGGDVKGSRLSFHEFLGALGALALAMYDDVLEVDRKWNPTSGSGVAFGGGGAGVPGAPTTTTATVRVVGGRLTADASPSPSPGQFAPSPFGDDDGEFDGARTANYTDEGGARGGGDSPSAAASPPSPSPSRGAPFPTGMELAARGEASFLSPSRGALRVRPSSKMTSDAYSRSLSTTRSKGRLREGGATLSAGDAVRILVDECVLPCAARVSEPSEDAHRDAVRCSGVRHLLREHERELKRMFHHYSATELIVAEKPRGTARRLRWSDVAREDGGMSKTEWKRFLLDFRVFPDLVSEVQAMRIFRKANHGARRDSDERALSYDEFTECLARVALTHGGYKPNPGGDGALAERAPPPPPPQFARAATMMPMHQAVRADGSPTRGEHRTLVREASRTYRDAYGERVKTPDLEALRDDPNARAAPKFVIRLTPGFSKDGAGARAPLYRERSYLYKESRTPHSNVSPSSARYDRVVEEQYCPVAGSPATYHRAMVDNLSRRDEKIEAAELRRRETVLRQRARVREMTNRRKEKRLDLEAHVGRRYEEIAPPRWQPEYAMISENNGTVKNLPRWRPPTTGVTLAKKSGSAPEASFEYEYSHRAKTTATELPDIHDGYTRGSANKMPNVLTVKRLPQGRFMPTNTLGGAKTGLFGPRGATATSERTTGEGLRDYRISFGETTFSPGRRLVEPTY